MAISDNEQKVLARAGRILEREMKAIDGDVLTSPSLVHEMIQYKIGVLEYEVLGVILLTNRHQLITTIELFRGTVDSCACYPREIVKLALQHNSAALLLFHNHPSMQEIVTPSDTDVRQTRKVTDALALVDIRVLDHIIVSGNKSVSLAERGLM